MRGSSQDDRRDLFEALSFVAAAKVKPQIEAYPQTEANATLDRLAAGADSLFCTSTHG